MLTQAGETRTIQKSSDIPIPKPEKASDVPKAHSLCREFLLMGFAETSEAGEDLDVQQFAPTTTGV